MQTTEEPLRTTTLLGKTLRHAEQQIPLGFS
jgi:hypothetical protein